jgi:formate dehydrogenase iron-sulfur subunit
MKIYLPLDSAAVALGADEIADLLMFQAKARGIALTLVRNGSRGMVWLEPMAEVVTDSGRMAFGPLTLADVPGLFDDLAAHPKALGLTENLPWLKAQTRLTFARVGVAGRL